MASPWSKKASAGWFRSISVARRRFSLQNRAMEPISIAFLVYPQVTQLDLTGPAQFFSRLGNQKLDLVWKTKQPVPTDCGFALLPTATFEEVREADILCVPGGFGCVDVMEDEEALGWVRSIGSRAE